MIRQHVNNLRSKLEAERKLLQDKLAVVERQIAELSLFAESVPEQMSSEVEGMIAKEMRLIKTGKNKTRDALAMMKDKLVGVQDYLTIRELCDRFSLPHHIVYGVVTNRAEFDNKKLRNGRVAYRLKAEAEASQ